MVTPVARGGTSVQATDARRRYAMPWWAGLLISLVCGRRGLPRSFAWGKTQPHGYLAGWVPTLTGDAASRLNKRSEAKEGLGSRAATRLTGV